MIGLFGRITGELDQVKKILAAFVIEGEDVLGCYEMPDSGCTQNHVHFLLLSTRFKSIKSARVTLSGYCKAELKADKQYSLKENDPAQDAEAYICKDKVSHSLGSDSPNNIFINTKGRDVKLAYKRYWDKNEEISESKLQTKNRWVTICDYIEGRDPNFFKKPADTYTPLKVASFIYDYYVSKKIMILGAHYQRSLIQTIVANKFNCRTLKKSTILGWVDGMTYWNGMGMVDDQNIPDEVFDTDADL